ncbi:MAG: protein kinase [Chloroflexi bacterium]|nr:protein kinase [Chloroflexota bacterium]MBT4072339.1 protein kinase [Chloroflexota bacterium]MBT4515164.1 protein kinase [Chloroflexota bacterium]MBT5319348.1 protein kinase [Chloroflexota bacterium]
MMKRVEGLLDDADLALDAGEWTRLRELCADVLAIDPDNGDAAALLRIADRREPQAETSPEQAPIVEDDAREQEPAPSEPVMDPVAGADSPPAAPAEVASEVPSSFSDGRYVVEKFLGEGGKKSVYLAHDTTLDRMVAFALIKTQGFDDIARARILREARAMGRLSAHESILTILDIGEDNGQPFMVTELAGGGDVEDLIADAEGHRVPMAQTLQIIGEVCKGLDFAHSHGVVHRDMKPGNVFMTDDGVAKIADFGLAVVADQSRLTVEKMMIGTVSYMPPEQATGGEVTARSDLYSLGAMMYEMVTGRPPFVADDEIAIISQHVNTPPVSPSWHNSDCPRPLEALIMRLLSKDPGQRPESAAEVIQVLSTIDPDAPRSVDPADIGTEDGGGVFVGRQTEMDQLRSIFEETLSGRGSLVALVGEPGIGKTRISQELAGYAGLRGARVLWGRCYESGGAPPYWPWVQAIRSYVNQTDHDQLRQEMGAAAADIAEIVPDVREALPELAGRTAPAEDPEVARFRLFDSITSFLRNASRNTPIVIVLDDLHWADQSSLLLLEFAGREIADGRILVMGNYRDVELNRRHPLAQTLGQLLRERQFERVSLTGLTEDDVQAFITIVAGLPAPPALLRLVYAQTEGNPLYVTEVVRLLAQEGLLTPERLRSVVSGPDGNDWNVRVPEGVWEVITRRLDRLSERCYDTLMTAAVIGRVFTLEQIDRLLDDMSEDRALSVLEEALEARIIDELPSAIGSYQFSHALIRETLAGEVSLARQARLHARIAEGLEDLYGNTADEHAGQLAHHYAEAGTNLDRLVHFSLVAGQEALDKYAYEDAGEIFERAIEASEPAALNDDLAALHAGLGAAYAALRHIDDALTHIEAAFNYYAESGQTRQAAAVAQSPMTAGEAQVRMIPMMEKALELVAPHSLDAGRIHSLLGRYVGVALADYDRAHEELDTALEIAQREQDVGLEMRTSASATMLDAFHLKGDSAVKHGQRVIELAGTHDDPLSESMARRTTAWAISDTGDRQRARKELDACIATAERARDNTWLATAHWAGLYEAMHCGNWRTARDHGQKALDAWPDDPRVFGLLAWLEFDTSNPDRGADYLQHLDRMRGRGALGLPMGLLHTAQVLPRIANITGDPDHTAAGKAAAEELLASDYRTPVAELVAHIGLGRAALLENDLESVEREYAALENTRELWWYHPVPVRAALAYRLGKIEQGKTDFEDAMERYREAGYRPHLAWTAYQFSVVCGEAGTESPAFVRSLEDDALEIGRSISMRPLVQKVLERREILKA